MTPRSRCPTTITAHHQVTTTRAEIIGNRWMVNTPLSVGIRTYGQHDTAMRLTLPDQTFWADVPPNAVLHIGNVVLYHLSPEQYESEVEISEFFSQHTLDLSMPTLNKIQFKGSRTISLTPLNEVLKELEEAKQAPNQPLVYTWSTPDTMLALTVGIGYIPAIIIIITLCKSLKSLSNQLNKCTKGMARIARQGL